MQWTNKFLAFHPLLAAIEGSPRQIKDMKSTT